MLILNPPNCNELAACASQLTPLADQCDVQSDVHTIDDTCISLKVERASTWVLHNTFQLCCLAQLFLIPS